MSRSALADPAATAAPSLERAPAGTRSSMRLVTRRRLTRALGSAQAPVLLIVAPAGSGKTVLLEQWAAADPRDFAWIRVGRARTSAAKIVELAARQLDDLSIAREPFVLVIDDIDAIWDPASSRELERLVAGIPAGSALALCTRSEPRLPLGRLRVHGQVAEFGPRDLAMTHREATQLLNSAAATIDPGTVTAVYKTTEGWTAGLRLAALAAAGPDEQRGIERFGGEDYAVAEYLRDEFLDEAPPGSADFMMRTSILDVLSGDVCDDLLGRSGSGSLLRKLSRSGQLVFATDRRDDEFRYHPLLTGMLRAELQRCDHALYNELHCRASTWYEAAGDTPSAVGHALKAKAYDRVADLVSRIAPSCAWGGGKTALEGWLSRIPAHEITRRPSLALAAAISSLTRGRCDEADSWTAAAERGGVERPARARGPLQDRAGAMRAATARAGVVQMRRDAAPAAESAQGDDPWRATGCLLLGSALILAGELESGRSALEQGVSRGAVAAPGIEALCLAQLGLVALFDDDWEGGAALSGRARSRAESLGPDDHPTMALVYAASAFARAYRGRPEDAQRDIAVATHLLDALDGFAPWHEAPARLALARAQLRLSKVAEARSLIREAAKVARRIPDAALVRAWADDAWARSDTFAIESLSGPSSLTTAELRVLRFLPSHLSFREIAERLYVSANTVKTQAHAVYRKLDASSRSTAVSRARQIGLLDT